MKWIQVTGKGNDKFWLNAECLACMSHDANGTKLYEHRGGEDAYWCVVETPNQILQQINGTP